MPDRIIRDELLRSHRYRTLSSDTSRLLFLHLLLNVDNLGNYEATSTAVADAMHRALDEATVAKLLSELADADLIRLYSSAGKPYLHVPRFRQRLKYLGSKHPRPPASVECNEISKLCEEYGLKAGERPPKGGIKAGEIRRSEVKRSEVNHPRAPDPPVDNSGNAKACFLENKSTPEKPKAWEVPSLDDQQGLDQFARDHGVDPQAFPTYPSLQQHLIGLVKKRNAKAREEAAPTSPVAAIQALTAKLVATPSTMSRDEQLAYVAAKTQQQPQP